MARIKKVDESKSARKIRPALTPEAREKQLISLAIDLAEKQMIEGTASSQVITHYLKLGTEKARLEREKLQRETELLTAKTEAIKSAERVEELYSKAIEAMQIYSGRRGEEDD